MPASSSTRASRSSMRGCRARNADYAAYLYERLQRKGYPAPRLPAPGQPGPQPFRRLHGGARRRRRDGDRRHAQFLGRARGRAPRDRSQARPSRHRRLAGAGARPHRAGRRHRRHRNAGRRGARRDRDRGGRRRAPARLRAARRAARLLDLRPSAGRARRAGAARRCSILDQRRVDFEYDGEMAADVALNPDADGGLSVLPPVRARPTC